MFASLKKTVCHFTSFTQIMQRKVAEKLNEIEKTLPIFGKLSLNAMTPKKIRSKELSFENFD